MPKLLVTCTSCWTRSCTRCYNGQRDRQTDTHTHRPSTAAHTRRGLTTLFTEILTCLYIPWSLWTSNSNLWEVYEWGNWFCLSVGSICFSTLHYKLAMLGTFSLFRGERAVFLFLYAPPFNFVVHAHLYYYQHATTCTSYRVNSQLSASSTKLLYNV